jgi:hypothetical protein
MCVAALYECRTLFTREISVSQARVSQRILQKIHEDRENVGCESETGREE